MSLDLTSLEKALSSLMEAAGMPKSGIVRDSVIKRFEYTYELSWKMIQRWLADNVSPEKADALTRKDLFRLAAQKGLVKDPLIWFEYHDARNKTSHTYDETLADEVHGVALRFITDAESLLEELKKRND